MEMKKDTRKKKGEEGTESIYSVIWLNHGERYVLRFWVWSKAPGIGVNFLGFGVNSLGYE